MNTKVTLARTPDGGLLASAQVDAAMIDMLGRTVGLELAQQLVSRLADEIIAMKKQEIIAKIPLEAVLNQVVAEVVRRIGEAK